MLKKLWQGFKMLFATVVKSVTIAVAVTLVFVFLTFGLAKINMAPKGYEHLIGKRVYQMWFQGIDKATLFPWQVVRQKVVPLVNKVGSWAVR